MNTAGLASGGHSLTAAYSGDTTFAGSRGTFLIDGSTGVLPIDVATSTQPDFSIGPCATSISVPTGGTTSGITYTVQPFNGFSGPVTFTISADGSLAATYNFSVSPVISGSGSTVLTLTASQTSTNGALTRGKAISQLRPRDANTPGSRRKIYGAGSSVALGAVLLLSLPKRRRWGALLAALLSVAAIGTLGCGSNGTVTQNLGSTGTPSITDTTPNIYYVTVTGTGTGINGAPLVHSSRIKFNVTN